VAFAPDNGWISAILIEPAGMFEHAAPDAPPVEVELVLVEDALDPQAASPIIRAVPAAAGRSLRRNLICLINASSEPEPQYKGPVNG